MQALTTAARAWQQRGQQAAGSGRASAAAAADESATSCCRDQPDQHGDGIAAGRGRQRGGGAEARTGAAAPGPALRVWPGCVGRAWAECTPAGNCMPSPGRKLWATREAGCAPTADPCDGGLTTVDAPTPGTHPAALASTIGAQPALSHLIWTACTVMASPPIGLLPRTCARFSSYYATVLHDRKPRSSLTRCTRPCRRHLQSFCPLTAAARPAIIGFEQPLFDRRPCAFLTTSSWQVRRQGAIQAGEGVDTLFNPLNVLTGVATSPPPPPPPPSECNKDMKAKGPAVS